MPNSERLLDYSDSSDESEGDGPNAIAKFVSAAAANSTIDAGVGNDNELLYCICIPDVGPPTPKNEDYEKTEQNTDRFFVFIIFKVFEIEILYLKFSSPSAPHVISL